MAAFIDHAIEPLRDDHDGSTFDCGEPWLNNYLRRHALRNQQLGYGRTYAAVRAGSAAIEGYYTLAMGAVVFSHLPEELSRQVPKYPMPVVHLGCLAVDNRLQGHGLGGILLIDAFGRIVSAADVVAARALEVRAISERARIWYLERGFLPFRDDPTHLYLPIDTIRRVLQRG